MTLVLDSVVAGYGNATVLRDVSLTVPTASVTALLGANGAGKTTLLRVASGMLPCRSGRIRYDDEDLTGQPAEVFARHSIGHIPEGRSIFPTMSVRENLVLFCTKGTEDESIERASSAFPRLGERINQMAGTLSGGEQQMLALARCYITKPAVVLVDEVSLGLAPKVVDEIFEFLRKLADEGVALLLVEQYVSKALAVADFVAILARGRLVFLGEPSELVGTDIFARYLGSAEQVNA
jgi:branched-chain amino acid transport system ATP-binding protein